MIATDPDGRVLLFRCNDPQVPDEPPFWLTPGGAVEHGEALDAAACRELFEETGLRLDPSSLVGPVAVCEGDWAWRGEPIHSIDTYFSARVDLFEIDRSGHDEIEVEFLVDHRWWSADDLDACTERVLPRGLAGLVRDISAGRTPVEPRHLPW